LRNYDSHSTGASKQKKIPSVKAATEPAKKKVGESAEGLKKTVGDEDGE